VAAVGCPTTICPPKVTPHGEERVPQASLRSLRKLGYDARLRTMGCIAGRTMRPVCGHPLETPASSGLLRTRSETLMVRSASSRVSNHEATHCSFMARHRSKHGPAIPPPHSASFAFTSRLLKIRGRRECRAPDAPAAARGVVVSTRVSHHGHTGKRPAFPAQWFYGLYRALPGDRALLPPSSLRSSLLKNLTPASGCQDHATSPSASSALVCIAIRVHRIPPHVRDDRETPL
jgi:hypothetical protein